MKKALLPIADLRAFLASRSPIQLWAAIGSLGMTLLMAVIFLIENRWGYMKPDPVLIYVNNWSEDRSLAEIETDQAKDLAARKEAIAAQKAEDARQAAIAAKLPPTHG